MKQIAKLIELTPATQGFLPDVRTHITRAVWRRVAGNDNFELEDDRVRELGIYLAFAALGFIGGKRIRTKSCETILIPVAFETGHFDVVVTVQHGFTSLPYITLSLPGESIHPSNQ